MSLLIESVQSPDGFGGVSRIVCKTFISRILWMYKDSSKHTTSLCKENIEQNQPFPLLVYTFSLHEIYQQEIFVSNNCLMSISYSFISTTLSKLNSKQRRVRMIRFPLLVDGAHCQSEWCKSDHELPKLPFPTSVRQLQRTAVL